MFHHLALSFTILGLVNPSPRALHKGRLITVWYNWCSNTLVGVKLFGDMYHVAS